MFQMLTLSKFLEDLSKIKGWKLQDGQIRLRRNPGTCPYLAVTGNTSDDLAHKIWAAADEKPLHDSKLRKKLLKACGLA